MSFGLAGSTITAIFYRTAAILFVISSCIGFIIGVVGFYKDSMAKAMLSLDLYPRLLQLHLESNFPWKGFRSWPLQDFRSVLFSRSWTLKSMLLVSWLTAQPAMDVSAQYCMKAWGYLLLTSVAENHGGEGAGDSRCGYRAGN